MCRHRARDNYRRLIIGFVVLESKIGCANRSAGMMVFAKHYVPELTVKHKPVTSLALTEKCHGPCYLSRGAPMDKPISNPSGLSSRFSRCRLFVFKAVAKQSFPFSRLQLFRYSSNTCLVRCRLPRRSEEGRLGDSISCFSSWMSIWRLTVTFASTGV